MDHGYNGIYAINNSQKSNNLMDFISSQNVKQSKINNYVTSNTHHGADYVNSYDHAAYTTFVKSKMNGISKKYELPSEIKSKEELEEVLKNLSLYNNNDSLIIFGTLLKSNDNHILEAIKQNNIKNIYIGISSYEKIREECSHIFKELKNKNLFFYDYKTSDVWGNRDFEWI